MSPEEQVQALLKATALAADELDEWSGDASSVLGGVSPGGLVRHSVQEALDITIDEWVVLVEATGYDGQWA